MEKQKNKEIVKERQVPEKKKKTVAELAKLIESNNTVMIVSTANLSALQFLKMKGVIKGKATIKIVKKNIMLKAMREFEEKRAHLKELEKSLIGSFAVLFSQLDAFELAALLSENKTPSKIKAGQIAPEDIIVPAGPTDLPAGPAISELNKIKIKAGIEGGKISIKESSLVAKKGQAVTEDVASVLAKLEINPITIGLMPLAAYDSKSQKIYGEIKIDKEATVKELKEFASRALAFSIEIKYPSKDNIKMLIMKLNHGANALNGLVK
jgi:large subunit ribosomal protein L10